MQQNYEEQLANGAKMMVTAGAMSTAEIGKIFAEMIRQDKVQIISCTGANLEDIMNLVAHSHYERVPNYRDLTQNKNGIYLKEVKSNRYLYSNMKHSVVCKSTQNLEDADDKENVIYMNYVQNAFISFRRILRNRFEDSWMYAAAEKTYQYLSRMGDSTMGNIFASYVIKGFKSLYDEIWNRIHDILADWYLKIL
jgi:deoxyhypusine synthase